MLSPKPSALRNIFIPKQGGAAKKGKPKCWKAFEKEESWAVSNEGLPRGLN